MLGDRIKEIRKGLGLTMKAFGSSLGLSESAISRIESGSKRTRLTEAC
ncbi:MAG: helix-turn-helix domain-containing protein [Holdemanella porci]